LKAPTNLARNVLLLVGGKQHESFEQEMQLLHGLQHLNILEFIGGCFITDDQASFMRVVTELCLGGSDCYLNKRKTRCSMP
jgi:hypothetical protein